MTLIERIFGRDEPMDETTPDTNKRAIGKIIKLSEQGYGFISSKDIPFTRIFFHWSSLVQDTLNFTELKNGMKVEFQPIQLEGRGWRAIRVKVIENGQEQTK